MSPAVSCVHHAPCDSRRPAHHAHHAPTPTAVVVLRPPRAPLAMLPQSCKRHTRPAHSVNHTTHAHAMDEVRPWWQGLAAAPGGDGGGCCWRRRRRRCWEASPRRDRRPGGIAGGHDARPRAILLHLWQAPARRRQVVLRLSGGATCERNPITVWSVCVRWRMRTSREAAIARAGH